MGANALVHDAVASLVLGDRGQARFGVLHEGVAVVPHGGAGAVALQEDYFDEERGNSVISGIIAYTEGESRGKVMMSLLPGQERNDIVTVKELEKQWREKVQRWGI